MTAPATAREIEYAEDPSRAIAALLSKLSDTDKRTFNALLYAAVAAAEARCNAEHQPQAWQAGREAGQAAERARLWTAFGDMTIAPTWSDGRMYLVKPDEYDRFAAALRAPEAGGGGAQG